MNLDFSSSESLVKKGKRHFREKGEGYHEARICRITGNGKLWLESRVWGREWWRHRRLEKSHALEGSVGKHMALSKRVIKEQHQKCLNEETFAMFGLG